MGFWNEIATAWRSPAEQQAAALEEELKHRKLTDKQIDRVQDGADEQDKNMPKGKGWFS